MNSTDNSGTADDADAPAAAAVVVIGAGPAGLTAAYMLAKRDVAATVLEADTVVGGISQTAERDGWRFDIGGHRFFTKVQAVEDVWFEILGPDDFLRRPRQSRIYYRGKFYDYPIVPFNALRNLGPVEAVRCMASYVWVRLHPPADRSTLEGFVASRFGWRLYRHFFKTQSEKVWGVPCTEIQADWGAQRIKDLSLFRAVWEALKPKRLRARREPAKQVTSLIDEFNYPKYGPGMMWERCAEIVTAHGTKVILNSVVDRIAHAGGRAVSVTAVTDGVPTEYECSDVISSMPISELLRSMDPPVPADVLRAANDLRYRAHITVALVVPEAASFPDNWIYINDANVKVGRIQNFGRWSPYLVKDGRTCLGLELFVDEGDEWWNLEDAELIERGKRELQRDRSARPGRRRGRLRGADAEGVPVLRRALQGQRGEARRVARRTRGQRVSGGPQRHAPLQQPGPLDADRDAVGGEHLRRAPRHLVRQRGSRVPRGAQRRRGRRRRLRFFVGHMSAGDVWNGRWRWVVRIATAVAVGVTGIVVLPSTSGTANPVVPTQWIAKQYSELLGRTPTDREWSEWVDSFDSRACTADALADMGRSLARSRGFAATYPDDSPLDQAQRFTALTRAALSRDPGRDDWNDFFVPYRDGGTWLALVDAVYGSSDFEHDVVSDACNPLDPDYGFGTTRGADRPLDLRDRAGLGASRTQVDVQHALDQVAASGGGTVALAPGEVIRVGGTATGNRQLVVPSGVTLTTDTAPSRQQYARMGRDRARRTRREGVRRRDLQRRRDGAGRGGRRAHQRVGRGRWARRGPVQDRRRREQREHGRATHEDRRQPRLRSDTRRCRYPRAGLLVEWRALHR